MTQRRMLANASFRLSDSNVTHDVCGRSPSDVRVCQECGEHFRPKRHWQKQCSPRCRQRAYMKRNPIRTASSAGGLEGAMRPYNIFGWAALAQESVSSVLVPCYSYKCPTVRWIPVLKRIQ
jgi:hypothetical protein